MAARPAASRSRTQTPQMHLPQCSRAPVRLLQNHCSAAMAVLQYSRVSAAMPPRCGPGDIRPLLAARPKSRSPEVYIYIYIYGGAPERRSFAEHASDSDAPGGRAGPVVCVRRPSDRSRESLSLFLSLSLPLPLSPFLSLSLSRPASMPKGKKAGTLRRGRVGICPGQAPQSRSNCGVRPPSDRAGTGRMRASRLSDATRSGV